jgi:hypothetical protein
MRRQTRKRANAPIKGFTPVCVCPVLPLRVAFSLGRFGRPFRPLVGGCLQRQEAVLLSTARNWVLEHMPAALTPTAPAGEFRAVRRRRK